MKFDGICHLWEMIHWDFVCFPHKIGNFWKKIYGRDYTTWYFTPVCENSVMFDMDIDCIFAIVKQRKAERSQYI